MVDKMWEKKVSAAAEAREHIMTIAGYSPDDTVTRRIYRAARRIPFLKASRVREIWYRAEKLKISADEMTQLRALAEKHGVKPGQATNELRVLEERIERLESLLASALSDADTYRNMVAKTRA